MALKLYSDTDMAQLADITRELCGTSITYTFHEMVEALQGLCEPKKINQIPLAVDASGNPYNNGLGYKSGYRLNSSGNETALAGKYVTGFIPVVLGQTVTLENIHLPAEVADNCYVAFYNSSKTLLSGCCQYFRTWKYQTGDALAPITVDADNYATSFTVTGSSTKDLTNVAFFRFNCNLIDSTSAIYVE